MPEKQKSLVAATGKMAQWWGRRREKPLNGAVPLATSGDGAHPMSDTVITPRTKVRPKTERPRLHKVILLNDDYTPRDFVVMVLKAVFRMNEDQAHRVMMTAHQLGACVVAAFTKDVAESKASEATEAGRSAGYPLMFTTEPEE